MQRLRTALRGGRGSVLQAPLDLVLDVERALVLHPVLAVLLKDRRTLRRDRGLIWGAPNLVVEIVWPATARRTRNTKVHWYADYGVQECWIIDTRRACVDVLDFTRGLRTVPHIYRGTTPVRSRVIPDCDLSPAQLFQESLPDDAGACRQYRRGEDLRARL